MECPFVLLKKTASKYVENKVYPCVLFGWFAVITYPLYYFIWRYTSFIGYENIYLRLIAVALGIPLILKDRWSSKIKFLFPVYWYCALTYCLPFLFTFSLLKNDFSSSAALNSLTVLTLSVLLLDIVPLIIITIIGAITGCLTYYVTTGSIYLPHDFSLILITSASIIVFGALFAHNKDIIHQTKFRTLKTISASMAHELKTPLRTIASYASGVKKYLPALLTTYEKATTAKLDVPLIMPAAFSTLERSVTAIEREANDTFTIINMLMVTAGMANALIDQAPTVETSAVECITEALNHYPYDRDEEKLVHWDAAQNQALDFKFTCKKLLVVHTVLNLLKNAFYYIKKASKGEIFIWLENDRKHNIIHVKDTSTGIAAKILPHIFDQFYSQTPHGTGIGLAFCKMVMQSLNGDIKCVSQEGEFTEFVLSFPLK